MRRRSTVPIIIILILASVLVNAWQYITYKQLLEDSKNESVTSATVYKDYIEKLYAYDGIVNLVTNDKLDNNPISEIVISKDKKAYVILDTSVSGWYDITSKYQNIKGYTVYNTQVKGYELPLKDVVSIDCSYYGNGGFQVMIFTTKDGKYYAINSNNLYNSKKIELYELKGLKNIVKFEGFYNTAYGLYAIDIDGQITNVKNLK